MKLSPVQQVIFVAAMIMGMLVVFHVPLGISDTIANVLQVLALVCLAIVIILWKRQKKGIVEAVPVPSKSRKTLVIVLVVLTSLSGPWWLPYTGLTLPFEQLVITSLVTCVLCISMFLVVWRRIQQRSNQSLEPTAGRRDVQI